MKLHPANASVNNFEHNPIRWRRPDRREAPRRESLLTTVPPPQSQITTVSLFCLGGVSLVPLDRR